MSYYIVILFIISGVLSLTIDFYTYKLAKMNKERKGASIVGWINASLGVVIFFVYWFNEKWYWVSRF